MKTLGIKLKKGKDYSGAICVLENFLEGALADYEEGDVDNVMLIENCIEAIYELGGYSGDYQKQYMKAKYGEKDED